MSSREKVTRSKAPGDRGSAAFAQQRVKKRSHLPVKPLLLIVSTLSRRQNDVQGNEDIDKRKTAAELASNYFPGDGKPLDSLLNRS